MVAAKTINILCLQFADDVTYLDRARFNVPPNTLYIGDGMLPRLGQINCKVLARQA